VMAGYTRITKLEPEIYICSASNGAEEVEPQMNADERRF